jgi:hypothetical protein
MAIAKLGTILIVEDVAKISTNKLSTFDFSTFIISQHVSTLNPPGEFAF